MVTELKAVYICKDPIEVKNPIPLAEDWHNDAVDSFQCSITMKTPRKILRWMTKGDREHSRFMNQLVALRYEPKHYEAIFRCLRYDDKIPRKYKRLYKEVIKRVKMPWQR